MIALPTTHDAKLACLNAAAAHGAAIAQHARIGAPAAALRSYLATAPGAGLALGQLPDGSLAIAYLDLVTWTVTLDGAGVVQGIGFSGFDDLMAALGIDFSGLPFSQR